VATAEVHVLAKWMGCVSLAFYSRERADALIDVGAKSDIQAIISETLPEAASVLSLLTSEREEVVRSML